MEYLSGPSGQRRVILLSFTRSSGLSHLNKKLPHVCVTYNGPPRPPLLPLCLSYHPQPLPPDGSHALFIDSLDEEFLGWRNVSHKALNSFFCVCVWVGGGGDWGRAVLICLPFASIWPVPVDNYACPAPDSGANNEGQIESYV